MDYFGAAAMDSYPAFERLRCCNCSREFNYSRDNVFVCGGRSPLCAACTTNTQSVGWPEPCRHLSRGCTFWEADEAALAEHQAECPHRPVSCILCECEAEEEQRVTKVAGKAAAAAQEDAEEDEGRTKTTKKKLKVKARDYVRHLLGKAHGVAGDGSWTLLNDRSALRLWRQDGLHFLAVLTGNDRPGVWQAWVETAAAPPKVAKKYRSAMRLSSEAGGSAFGTFEAPVWSMEDLDSNVNKTDILFISGAEFECHNGGRGRLGEHNRTGAGGAVELPISVTVERVGGELEEGEIVED